MNYDLSKEQIEQLKQLGFVSPESIVKLNQLLGTSQKITVSNRSIEELSENGFDIDDKTSIEDDVSSDNRKDQILSLLTKKQREVVVARMEGNSRREIAEQRGISLQSVHQMFPRIKKRLIARGMGNEKSAY